MTKRSARILGRPIGALVMGLYLCGSLHAGTSLISVAAHPAEMVHDGPSGQPQLSGDGRHLVYVSQAGNIVPGDDNGLPDIFLYDALTQVHERISQHPNGQSLAATTSSNPAISTDGRYVTMRSGDAFMPGTGGGLYRLDRLTGTRALLSIRDDESLAPPIVLAQDTDRSVSDNARFACFSTATAGLVAGDLEQTKDVFLRDHDSGTTRLVSVALGGGAGNGESWGCAVSNDGRYVAFTSGATNLIAGDANAADDVFVRDMLAGTTQRASRTHAGAEIAGDSRLLTMNEDGTRLAFVTEVDGVSPADNNGVRDAFAIRLSDGLVQPLSVDVDGIPAGVSSWFYSMRGSRILLSSDVPLLPGEAFEWPTANAYLVDLGTQQIRNVTVQLPGHALYQQVLGAALSGDAATIVLVARHRFDVPPYAYMPENSLFRLVLATQELTVPSLTGQVLVAGNQHSGWLQSAMDASGRWVAFHSEATNLDTPTALGGGHVYLRDRLAGTTMRLVPESESDGPCGNHAPGMSADGRYVLVVHCVSGAGSVETRVFRLDRSTGQRAEVSAAPDGTPANGSSSLPSMSADGNRVVFASFAQNLVPGSYSPGHRVLFEKDMTTGAVRRITGGTGLPEPILFAGFRLSEDGRWLQLDQGSSGSALVDLDAPVLSLVRAPLKPNGLVPAGLVRASGRVLSADAQWLAFAASDATLTGTNGAHVYISQLSTRSFELVSRDDSGQPFFQASMPSMSSDARFVAFAGQRTSVEPNRIHVRDRLCGRTIAVTPATLAGGPTVVFRALELSTDGRKLTFASNQPDLVADDGNRGLFDTFISEGYVPPSCDTGFFDGFE